MSKIDKQKLAALYDSSDISMVWRESQNQPVIDHPKLGMVSPNGLRAAYRGKPCPFCGQKMTHGPDASTPRKSVAIARGYQYIDTNDKERINKAGNDSSRYTYFHPHYVTLDHRLNKARCPERMFDADNLEVICWRCNNAKGDNNAYELQDSLSYIQDLAQETLDRYPLL